VTEVGATIRDVALAAGVSTATVSRALRGLSNVNATTRDRIVGIARDMDFSVSRSASRLATGRTGTIGIITPYVGRWYFTEVFAGVEEGLKPYDVDLLLHTTEPSEASPVPEAHVRMRRRVDGVLVMGIEADREEIKALAELNVPVVLLGAQTPGAASVSIDDRLGSRSAVQHLAERGHERIGLITGRRLPTRFLPENDRLAGYLDVMADYGLAADPDLREIGLFTTRGGERAMRTLLGLTDRPTAVFCMSDEMAFGALRAMRQQGVVAGGDIAAGQIAVIGFDGHDLAEAFDLSTVSQPVRALGRAAAGMLMARIAGTAHPRVTIMPTELVPRGSTGC
jgi:DNA-binding LacI/PurR family transcriptional regulator